MNFYAAAPSLALRSSPGNGFFVHLSRAKRDKSQIDSDPEFYGIGETLSTKSYFHRVSTVNIILTSKPSSLKKFSLGQTSETALLRRRLRSHLPRKKSSRGYASRLASNQNQNVMLMQCVRKGYRKHSIVASKFSSH